MIAAYTRVTTYQAEQWDGTANPVCGELLLTGGGGNTAVVAPHPNPATHRVIIAGDWVVRDQLGGIEVYADRLFRSLFMPTTTTETLSPRH